MTRRPDADLESRAAAFEAVGALLDTAAPLVLVHRRKRGRHGARCGAYTGQIDNHGTPTCPVCLSMTKGRRER